MGKITVVGVGWEVGHLTLDAIEALTGGARVLLHTDRCGCAAWLRDKGVDYRSLDALYDECDDFDAHVERAVQAVLEAAQSDDVVYGVLDVRDRSVARLTRETGVRVIAGPPAEGALLALAVGEARCVEASDWESFHLTPRENCFVREIDGRELACAVKLQLMEVYPENQEIWLLRGGRAPEKCPLFELDRGEEYDHRTCALIPAERDILKLERFDEEHLNEIIRALCGPGGCPWDRAQTHESLRPFILEESCEVIDAIDDQSPEHLYEELGDVLLQIALHAEIGRKHGEFDMSDVATSICRKMIDRHPHVFGCAHADNPDQVLDLWERAKMAERGQKTRAENLRSITRSLPALTRAVKILYRASEEGISCEDVDEALTTAREKVAALGRDSDEQALGEALLALCDVARKQGFDPEIALSAALRRLIDRFEAMEARLLSEASGFDAVSPERLREYWEMVKL